MSISLASWHSVTVCGMKGTGKTFLERYGLLPRYQNILIFDPNDEFQDFPGKQYIPKTDSPLELDRVAKQVWVRGNTLLLVSEAELYLPVNRPLPPNIFKIVCRGRHRNVGVISDTRRIANLNKTVFGLSEHCFIFRHFSPTDIRYLSEFLPVDCRQLASLEDFHFWHYTRGKVEECPPIVTPGARKRGVDR